MMRLSEVFLAGCLLLSVAGGVQAQDGAATEAQRQARLEELRQMSPEQRQARREQMQKRLEGLTDEQRAALRERRQQNQANRAGQPQRPRVQPNGTRPGQSAPPADAVPEAPC